jgi:hypothetical protein
VLAACIAVFSFAISQTEEPTSLAEPPPFQLPALGQLDLGDAAMTKWSQHLATQCGPDFDLGGPIEVIVLGVSPTRSFDVVTLTGSETGDCTRPLRMTVPPEDGTVIASAPVSLATPDAPG